MKNHPVPARRLRVQANASSQQQTLRRPAARATHLAACALAVGIAPLWAGCLPDPDIAVPDFSLPSGQLTDMAVPVSTDGPIGDLGSAKWTPEAKVGATEPLRAAWVSDPGLSEIYVVGQAGTVLHRSGGDWKRETSGTTADLYGIAGRSVDELYAVGRDGVILRRSAGKWSTEGRELATGAALFGVTVLATGEVIVAGDQAMIARRQLAGVWIAEDTNKLIDASLRAVTGTTGDALWAVGLDSAVARRGSDGVWSLDAVKIGAADRTNIYAVTVDSGTVYVAGEYGKVLARSETKWTAEPTIKPAMMAAPLHFYGLYSAAGDVIAVGSGGMIQRRSGIDKTWSVEPSGVMVDLFGVTGAGLRSTIAVGAQGTLLRRM